MEGYAADFLRYLRAERNASEHTAEAYSRDILEFVTRVKGSDESFNDWAGVDRDDAKIFLVKLHEAGDGKRSMQRKLSAMRSFFRYLVRSELVKENPFLRLPPVKADQPLPLVMSVNQIDRLTAAVEAFWNQALAAGIPKSEESAAFSAARDLAMIEVIYSGGLRISEAVGLNYGDIDLIGGVARVRGKGKKERLAVLGRPAERALRSYFKLRAGLGAGRMSFIRLIIFTSYEARGRTRV